MKPTIIAALTGVLLLNAFILPGQNNFCDNLINEIYSDAQIKKPGSQYNPSVEYRKNAQTQISDICYTDDYLGGRQCSIGKCIVSSCNDGGLDLIYEVYYPDIAYSDIRVLPAIILFHAGGFSDCSSMDSGDGMDVYCTEFAKRGFVAFNVEYRRGRIEDNKSKYTSASHFLAVYRAFQDGRGALRSIVASELSRATSYRIDLNNLFVGGCSAGGYIALNMGYYTLDMNNQVFTTVKNSLGSVDINNYSGNTSRDAYTIKGVLNMWGGALIPLNFVSSPQNFFLQNPYRPGLIAFHGGQDPVININSSDIFFSAPPSVYSTESLCVSNGTYTLPDNGAKNPDLKLLGSQKLCETFKTAELDMPCELYIDCDMPHGLDENHSDFGLAGGNALAVSNTDVQKYIVQRATTFFQLLMNNHFKYTIGHTKLCSFKSFAELLRT